MKRLIILITLTWTMFACTSTPTLVKEKAVKANISPDKIIHVIPVKITYEKVSDRSPLDPEKYQSSKVAEKIETTAMNNFQKKKFSANKLTDDQLADRSNKLFRRNIDEKTKNQLDTACADKNNAAVLAHYMRVKVGSTGSWNPQTGAITSNNSTSYLQAGLFDCETKDVLWRNAVFFRAVPAASNNIADETQGDENQLNKALSTLYESIQ